MKLCASSIKKLWLESLRRAAQLKLDWGWCFLAGCCKIQIMNDFPLEPTMRIIYLSLIGMEKLECEWTWNLNTVTFSATYLESRSFTLPCYFHDDKREPHEERVTFSSPLVEIGKTWLTFKFAANLRGDPQCNLCPGPADWVIWFAKKGCCVHMHWFWCNVCWLDFLVRSTISDLVVTQLYQQV